MSWSPEYSDWQDFIYDPTYPAVRDLDAIKILHMAHYDARTHSLCVHRQDLFLHVLCDSVLLFLENLQFEFAVPVSWTMDLHITLVGV